jgi:hypothetical protein
MRRILRCIGLTLALAVLPAVVAQDKKPDDKNPAAEKKGDDKKPDEKKPDDKKGDTKTPDKDKKGDDKNAPKDKKEAVEKLVVGREISGKLIHWEGTDKYFTVQVSLTYSVPDANAIKHLADLQAQYQRQALARDGNGMRNTAIEMAKVQTYQVKKEDHNIDFQPAADMKVRILHPMEYDDKGKPRKMTPKELAERKGPDKKLPGYTGEVADIRQDSYVTVYLPKAKSSKPAAGASKDDYKPLADSKPEAIMILIVGEAPPPK